MAKKSKATGKSAKVVAANEIHEERQRQYTKAAEVLAAVKDKQVKSELYAKILEALSLKDVPTSSAGGKNSRKSAPMSSSTPEVAHTPPFQDDGSVNMPVLEPVVPGLDALGTAEGYEFVFPTTSGEDTGRDGIVHQHATPRESSSEECSDNGDVVSVAISVDSRETTVPSTVRSFFVMSKRDCWASKRQAVIDKGGRPRVDPINVLQAACQLVGPDMWVESVKTVKGRQVPLLGDGKGETAAVDAKAVYKELLVGEYMCTVTPDQCVGTEVDSMWRYGLEGGVLQ
ncbi:hypothetical protein M409DRAFT_61723 [Zasmidium cellare ATCC 36951]|uniref:Uncharacterized protein n=1 Tax=Zasmidium cellare ATCC 36951 TaxID=1080233 RepID=A0A6A6BXS9_ZASCE|nr:uncharacterized protein M409DRAFT_61723 [Zasmidium cellare ATCC 36951]KAF2158362.1 hypothetical protein M409DRAFT_61723 [Zasmidium cellare ATCC 36951]